MLGMHGTYEANMAMNRCDLIIAVGARFDDRVTGRLDAFSPDSKKIHIDIDRSSINKIVPVDLADRRRRWPRARRDHRGLAGGGHNGREALANGGAAIDGWRATRCLDFPEKKEAGDDIMPQRAVSGFVRRDARARPDHHHRGRPAPDVGGAAFRLLWSRTAG
jgi:acetolactate synthase-1/2/3 large subunit